VKEGFHAAGELWLPSDPDLPPHYTQAVHHETRQRWASQLLEKLFLVSDEDDSEQFDWEDPRFDRLVQAAAIPHETSTDRPQKEGTWMLKSLQGIHGIVSRKLGLFRSQDHPSYRLKPDTLNAIATLIERACVFSDEYSMDQACQLYWSIEGLYARIPELERCPTRQHLQERLSHLPFQIVPRGFDWTTVQSSDKEDNTPLFICKDLIDAIPFSKDTIMTRRGVSVTERRGTAWIAQEGIGNLAYSGKLMTPQPIPPLVSQVMRSIEERLVLGDGEGFFDCALCNHYSDATAACKFHTDPEHGSVWDRTTIVVAAGTDRKFAFKPIDTTWKEWDPLKLENGQQSMAASIHLFSGDLVVMRDNCNDDFYHAVQAGANDKDRVSLVFKRALDRGNGRKGHGQQGQGRRSKRKLKNSMDSKSDKGKGKGNTMSK
jgi:alkylated DNA repair dioxygenase AlkB